MKNLRVITLLVTLLAIHVSKAQVCFTAQPDHNVGYNAKAMCYADFNNDGKIDLAVTNLGNSNVSILFGDGTGNFSASQTVDVGALPTSICSGDFNNDGKMDLAIHNTGPGNVSIFLSDGTGNFSAGTGFSTGVFNGTSQIISADINQDNNDDLILTTGFNYILVALSNGNGSFATPTSVPVDNNTAAITVADFNNDGKADLAVTTFNVSYQVSVLLGNGLGAFGAAQNFTTGIHPESIVHADFNGDGKTDIATANKNNYTTGTISILLGNGNGSFASANNFNLNANAIPFAMCSADFDGDGIVDLATATVINNGMPSLSISIGDGTGGFATPTTFAIDSFPQSIVSADFNGDGKKDLAITSVKTNIDTGNVSVLLNCNTASIQQPVAQMQLNVYPNPGTGQLNIISSENMDELKITDALGRVIENLKPNTRNISLHLSRGLYCATVLIGKQSSTTKFIVTQ